MQIIKNIYGTSVYFSAGLYMNMLIHFTQREGLFLTRYFKE